MTRNPEQREFLLSPSSMEGLDSEGMDLWTQLVEHPRLDLSALCPDIDGRFYYAINRRSSSEGSYRPWKGFCFCRDNWLDWDIECEDDEDEDEVKDHTCETFVEYAKKVLALLHPTTAERIKSSKEEAKFKYVGKPIKLTNCTSHFGRFPT